MSSRMPLSPQASTRIPRRRIAAQNSWGAAPAPSRDMSLDLSLDIGFLPSWFESDPDPGQSNARPTTWSSISGLALAVAVSASCWAGVAWVVARVWR